METINLKRTLIGLFILAFLTSVIFTSCQKEEVTENVLEKEQITLSQKEKKATGYAVPAIIAEKGDDAVLDYLTNLDAEEMAQSELEYELAAFLSYKDLSHRLNATQRNAKEKIELSNYLTAEEINEFQTTEWNCSAGPNGSCYIPSGYSYYFKHDKEEVCCEDGHLCEKGPLYRCSNGKWALSQIFCKNFDTCNSSNFCFPHPIRSHECITDLNYLCNSTLQPNDGPVSMKEKQNISTFLASELSPQARILQNLYIKNITKVNGMFQSEDTKYRTLQENLEAFLTANIGLISSSFSEEKGKSLQDENLQPALQLLEEMAKVIDDSELEQELKTLTTNLQQAKGRTLKEILRTYGQ